MVTGNLAHKLYEKEKPQEKDYTFLPEKPKWTTVSLLDIVNNNYRFEASAFSLDAKIAINKIKKSKYEYVHLWSDKGFINDCFYGGRAKRNYVSKFTKGAIGFIGSAEMLEIKPRPIKFLTSLNMNIKPFKVDIGTILISRSGTIGNVTYVSKTLSKLLVSEHAIRIIANKFSGYVYAYLKTDIGKTIVKSNTFGAVVDQIEPEHLKNVIIPNPPEEIKKKVHDLIVKSYDLRDQSNELIDQAENILYEELKLPPIEELQPEYFDTSKDLRNFETKLSELNYRLDASYHLPIVKAILKQISKSAKEIKKVGDDEISEKIILPGRFKRIYVDKENGIKFIGGKQIGDLNPITDKYLSSSIHATRAKDELILHENTILITRSGTIGKIAIAPKHWDNWAANEHIIRVFPKSSEIAGYLFTWLNSEYGNILIKRNTYGAVVDEIDTNHVASIEIPILKDQAKQKEINDLVLKANELRYEAYLKEQEAIRIVNEEVINETKDDLSIAAEKEIEYKKSNKS